MLTGKGLRMVHHRPQVLAYTYGTLSELTGMNLRPLHQQECRGNLGPNDLGPVVCFIVRYGRLELRQNMLEYAIPTFLPPKEPQEKRKKKGQ